MKTNLTAETKRRERILAFWSEHGDKAAGDAFGVSRSTLFRWKKDAVPKSRAHRNGYLKRTVPAGLETEIRRLRAEHPKLGKDLPAPVRLRMSGKTGRLLEKPPKPKERKLRRDGYLPVLPGDLVQVDGVLIFAGGVRRYTFTAVDLVSRWAFGRTYASQSSRNGADFLRRLLAAAPFEVRRVQTDNGSEFLKEFGDAVEAAELVRFFNWVRQPKFQGWVERFNRSLQEEFLDWRHAALAGPADGFNPELEAWLAFYNGSRVHRSLGTSCQRLTPLQYLALAGQCQTG